LQRALIPAPFFDAVEEPFRKWPFVPKGSWPPDGQPAGGPGDDGEQS